MNKGVKKGIATRIALVAAVALVLVTAWWLGLFALLSNPEQAAELLRSMGVWGYVLYVASFALLEPFFVPGILFIFPAALIWPSWLAFVLSLLGATGAGAVGFVFARFLARDWVSAHIPERVRRWDEGLAARPIRTVVLIRLLFFLLPPAHWALGLSAVRFPALIVGTLIGFIPGIAALTFVGGGLADSLGGESPDIWRWVALAVVVLVALNWLSRRRRSKDSKGTSQAPLPGEPTDP